MGAYLSEPVTNTVTEEGDSQKLEYGASSMQGWRVSQEVCIILLCSIQIIHSFNNLRMLIVQ